MPSRTSTSSPHAIDSKPRRRKSMTIPGQVSSASTAHQSCPITFTGRTRKGRLRSPRVAKNVVRFFAALFMIGKTVPSVLEQHLHCSPPGLTLQKYSCLFFAKNYSFSGSKEGTQRLYLNIPHASINMPVITSMYAKKHNLDDFDKCL